MSKESDTLFLAGQLLTFLDSRVAKGMSIKRLRENLNRTGLFDEMDFHDFFKTTEPERTTYLLSLAQKEKPFNSKYDRWRDAVLAYYLQVIKAKYPNATPEPLNA